MTTDNHTAMPPSMAVGLLCQRSVFGLATMPYCLASARTSGVRASANKADAAKASSCVDPNDIRPEKRKQKCQIQGQKKASRSLASDQAVIETNHWRIRRGKARHS